MSTINWETMALLRDYIGKDVILQGVSCGEEYSYRTKLWKATDFGAVNGRPLIGMNSAVTAVIDVETGKFLMQNKKIKTTLDWNDSTTMWWLRFRSYGFLVTFKMSPVETKRQELVKWLKSRPSFCT